MSRVPLSVQVAPRDQIELHKLLSSGIQPVRVVLRALTLLHLADGATAPATAVALKNITPKAVRVLAHRYLQAGLDRALYEKQRPGAAPRLETAERQRIIAMVCAAPPEGQARWTVRLIAPEGVKRQIVPRVGRGTGRIFL